jgi:hypothetical protein
MTGAGGGEVSAAAVTQQARSQFTLWCLPPFVTTRGRFLGSQQSPDTPHEPAHRPAAQLIVHTKRVAYFPAFLRHINTTSLSNKSPASSAQYAFRVQLAAPSQVLQGPGALAPEQLIQLVRGTGCGTSVGASLSVRGQGA